MQSTYLNVSEEIGIIIRRKFDQTQQAFCTGNRMSTDLSRVRGFDGLRGLAAIAVFIEHKVSSGYGLGGLGVWLFFTLSGYLIIGILHRQREFIELRTSDIFFEMKLFWKRRILRIFPLYYLFLLCVAVYLWLKGQSMVVEGLHWYAAYVSNFFIAYVSHTWSKFSHLWSLAVEQQFYLLAAPVFLFIPVLRHKTILFVTVAMSIIVLILAVNLFDNPIALYLSPLPNFGFMAIGGILALDARRWEWSATTWNTILLTGMLTIPAIAGIERLVEQEGTLFAALKFLVGYWFSFSVIGYVGTQQSSRFTRILSFRMLAYIGTISYGFYIFHLFSPSYDFAMRFLPFMPRFLMLEHFWFVAQFFFTVGVASASWFLFEKPILALKVPSRLRRNLSAKNISGSVAP